MLCRTRRRLVPVRAPSVVLVTQISPGPGGQLRDYLGGIRGQRHQQVIPARQPLTKGAVAPVRQEAGDAGVEDIEPVGPEPVLEGVQVGDQGFAHAAPEWLPAGAFGGLPRRLEPVVLHVDAQQGRLRPGQGQVLGLGLGLGLRVVW
jgi:hypothetical protein